MKDKIDYHPESLIKRGGKVTGRIGFPGDPKTYTGVCKVCKYYGLNNNNVIGCMRPFLGTDWYVWVTMPNGEIIATCYEHETLESLTIDEKGN